MILLGGLTSDSSLILVEKELQIAGLPFVWFDQRRFAEIKLELTISPEEGLSGTMTISDESIPLTQFTGIYQRLIDERAFPEFSGGPREFSRRMDFRALHATFHDWLEAADPVVTRVVNRPKAMDSCFSKPYQLQLVARHGFLVPPTLVTNDPVVVRAFLDDPGLVIYKTISGVRSVVRVLEEEDLARVDSIRSPRLFQAYIVGINVRVHVIGREVFGCSARTGAIDYRDAPREGYPATVLTPFALSENVAEKCIRVATALDLSFAALDLKITPDGQVYCLDIDPNPAFSTYQEQTGQNIAGALVSYLSARPDSG